MKKETQQTPWALMVLFYIVAVLSTGASALAKFVTTWFQFVDMFGIRWQWQYLYYYTFVYWLRFGWCSFGLDKLIVKYIGTTIGITEAQYATFAASDDQKTICKEGFDLMWDDMWYDSKDTGSMKILTDYDMYNYTP